LEKRNGKKETSTDKGVSEVVGVILVVAIAFIIAAVFGTLALKFTNQLGEEAQAGVNINGNTTVGDGKVEISLTTLGNSNYVLVRGDVNRTYYLKEAGTQLNLTVSGGQLSSSSGRLTVVAVMGPEPEPGETKTDGDGNKYIDSVNVPVEGKHRRRHGTLSGTSDHSFTPREIAQSLFGNC